MNRTLLFFALFGGCVWGQENLARWSLVRTVALEGRQHHVQGVDTDGARLWVSSVDAKAGKGYLTVYEVAGGRLLKQIEVQQGARIHPGGLALDGGAVWLPVAEYDRDGPTSIQQRDAETLELRSSFDVADHIGCVAVAKAWLVGANWDARRVYHWSRDGSLLGSMDNPRALAWQDIKVVDGRIVASGLEKSGGAAIEWLDMDDLRLIRRVDAGKTDRGVRFTQEGMTIHDGLLYLMPEDGDTRVFVFRMR